MGRRRWCLQPWLEQVLICFAYQGMVLGGLESVSSSKKWCTVLLASILLCDEDVTLALPCVCVPPCTLPSQRWLKLFQEISNRKSGYEQNSLLICNGFPFFYPFLYAKQGWRFDDKAHLLGFGFDYHIQCHVFIQLGLSALRVPADFSSLSNFPWYLPLPLFFTPNPPPPQKKKKCSITDLNARRLSNGFQNYFTLPL